jgi:hypothetical protein
MPELDLGNVKGPQGKSAYQSALDAGYSGSEEAFNTAMAKAPDAVLYTVQSLTDEQKAQARGNINAAPGGFGLGAIWNQAPENDANQIPGTGWFVAHKNTPTSGWWIIQDIFDGSVHYQFAFAKRSNSGVLGGTIVQRNKQEQNDWSPWEWVNPPMGLNTEYRTTERYLRKPVYTKTFNIPVSAFENQLPSYSHGIDHLDRLVDARVYCRADWIRILPWSYFDSTAWSAQYMLNSSAIKFELGSSALARIKEYTNGVDVTLKYTKTTD